MLAVSNTSPLRYLIIVGQADLLSRLFAEVFIPPGVAAELSDAATPLAVRQWIARPPAWLRIHTLSSPPDAELMATLDRGEREAIQLAVERQADVLIMDEWKGRAIVQSGGLPLIGALGVLGEAYRQGAIDDPLRILADMPGRFSDQRTTGCQVPGSSPNALCPMKWLFAISRSFLKAQMLNGKVRREYLGCQNAQNQTSDCPQLGIAAAVSWTRNN